jgi:hypothetical protein
MIFNLSLGSREQLKQVCRVCHEFAELKIAQLCGECVWVKAQIQRRISQLSQPSDAEHEQRCSRSGCSCAACGRRILDPHPFCSSVAERGREIHFHPRCHELWMEASGWTP